PRSGSRTGVEVPPSAWGPIAPPKPNCKLPCRHPDDRREANDMARRFFPPLRGLANRFARAEALRGATAGNRERQPGRVGRLPAERGDLASVAWFRQAGHPGVAVTTPAISTRSATACYAPPSGGSPPYSAVPCSAVGKWRWSRPWFWPSDARP